MHINIKQYFSSAVPQNEDLNLHTIFKPLYRLLILLGLFPYSVRYNKSKHEYKIVTKSIYMNSICAVSILLIVFTFYIAHIQYLLTHENNSWIDGLMSQMNYIIEMTILVFYCPLAYICAFLNRRKYVKILNEICSVWVELANDDSKKILAQLRFHVNVPVMGFLFLVVILQMCLNCTRNDSLWKMILVTFSCNLPQTIQFFTLGFFYVLVVMVTAILKNVNEHALRFTKEKEIRKQITKVNERFSEVTLKEMAQVYGKSFEIIRDINDSFKALILVSTLQCFHSIVSEAYIIYHGVVRNTISTHALLNYTIWIMYQLIKIYALAQAGSGYRNEALKIGQSLHKIPTEKQDIRILMEIQHFTSLMQHQGTVLTVYGFFPLDATLISKMIATVTMYLIILVQFDKSNEEK